MENMEKNVRFDEPEYARPASQLGRDSWPTRLVLKSGLAKDSAGAQKVLLVVFVLVVLATIWAWPKSPNQPQESPTTQQ